MGHRVFNLRNADIITIISRRFRYINSLDDCSIMWNNDKRFVVIITTESKMISGNPETLLILELKLTHRNNTIYKTTCHINYENIIEVLIL